MRFSVPAVAPKAVLQPHASLILGAAGHNKQDNFLLPLIGVEFRWQIEGLPI